MVYFFASLINDHKKLQDIIHIESVRLEIRKSSTFELQPNARICSNLRIAHFRCTGFFNRIHKYTSIFNFFVKKIIFLFTLVATALDKIYPVLKHLSHHKSI